MIKQRRIIKILGYNIGELPPKYLGMSLFMGRLREKLWDDVLDKIDKQLVG